MRRSGFAAVIICAWLTTAASAAQVSYYQLPSGAAPHDVAPAADGTVWYTGQRKGFLGRLDPKTGKNEEIPLGPNAAPHGVIVGPDGAAWVTEGGQNAIARVDPDTRAVKLFRLPKEFPYTNLNTATFDRSGTLWFTGQAGFYGRVFPATGKVDAWKAPKGYGPYGITTTPSGEVWYVSLAGDHIARIDTETGAVMVVDPPKPGSGARRIWSDSKGILWVRAASGRTPRASCGRACGILARSAVTIRRPTRGRPGSSPTSGADATRSMSTTRTRSGSPTSPPTQSCGSIR